MKHERYGHSLPAWAKDPTLLAWLDSRYDAHAKREIARYEAAAELPPYTMDDRLTLEQRAPWDALNLHPLTPQEIADALSRLRTPKTEQWKAENADIAAWQSNLPVEIAA